MNPVGEDSKAQKDASDAVIEEIRDIVSETDEGLQKSSGKDKTTNTPPSKFFKDPLNPKVEVKVDNVQ